MQDDIPIFLTVVALLIVLFMPALGRAFGFSDRLQRMSDALPTNATRARRLL